MPVNTFRALATFAANAVETVMRLLIAFGIPLVGASPAKNSQ
jgi:hypothetical protein